jgi:hypothetical protein
MKLEFLPITEFSDRDWYDAYLAAYDKNVAFEMGLDPKLIVNPPPLTEFYDSLTEAVNNNTGYGWAIKKNGEYLGHIMVDKKHGVWEFGGSIKDPENRHKGTGVRASMHALKWIFEVQNEEWAIAFARSRDPRVKKMLLNGGFRPFMNFLVMDRRTWDERWAGRVKWTQ